VDLTPITSSWGNVFRIGPVIKSSDASNGSLVTSAFVNATAISASQLPLDLGGSGGLHFDSWRSLGGVVYNGTNRNLLPGGPINDGAEPISLTGSVRQMSVGFIERNSTGATGNAAYQGIIGGFIKLSDNDPTRAYVTRIEAAANNAAPGSTTASFGFGGVDSHGNLAFRTDGNGQDATNPRTIGATSNNYTRVDLQLRTPSTNWIRVTRSGAGTLADPIDLSVPLAEQNGVEVGRDIRDAVTGAVTTVNTPTIASEQVAGRPIVIGSSFDKFFRYESAPGVLSATQTHFNALNTDHRGNASYTFRNFFSGSVAGTSAFVAFEVTIGRATGDATSITAFGLAADGAPQGEYLFELPSAAMGLGMTDPYGINPATSAPFDTATDYPLPPGASLPVFFLYQGNTAFAGGAGQAAVGVDPAGNLMVAGTVAANSPPGSDPIATDRRNYIAVGRTASAAGPTQWVAAAWVTSPDTTDPSLASGKTIEDGAGNPVGTLTTFADYRIANGGASLATGQGGPSMSVPAFDSVGNIYFIAPARLTTSEGFARRLCVIRGVRQESPFGYKLEKVVAEGDLITGANSGAVYRVSGLNLTVANATGAATGIANGTIWSSSTNQETAGGLDRGTLETRDPRTLGGLVVAASITYDENANGSFADLTDQNYQAMLFLSGGAPIEAPVCIADFNGDGLLNPDDLSEFITCFFLQLQFPGFCPAGDFNQDGLLNPDDLSEFITTFFLSLQFGC
jgi:hypothetical protein